MELKIKYSDGLIIAFSISYIFIGIINLFGLIDSKIILLCSIVAFLVAIIQIFELLIAVFRVMETCVIKLLLGTLEAWGTEHSNEDIFVRNNKIKEFNENCEVVRKKYSKYVKRIQFTSNLLFISALVLLFVGMATDFIKGNSILADTLSLFSFALIFISVILQSYIEQYIRRVKEHADKVVRMIED